MGMVTVNRRAVRMIQFYQCFGVFQLTPCVATCATTATVPTPRQSCVLPPTPCARPSPPVGNWCIGEAKTTTTFSFSHCCCQSSSASPPRCSRWRWTRTAPSYCPASPLPTQRPNGRWTKVSTGKVTLKSAAWLTTATSRLWPVRSSVLCCYPTMNHQHSHSWIRVLLVPVPAVPNVLMNGKECPGCASSMDSLAGTCNATVGCMGVEDSCFNGTSEFTLRSFTPRGEDSLCTSFKTASSLDPSLCLISLNCCR